MSQVISVAEEPWINDILLGVYDIMLEKIRNRPVEVQYQAIITLRDAAATIASNIAKSNSGLVSMTKSSSEKEPADFAADVEASDLTTSVNDYYDTNKAPVNGMIPGSMVPMLGNTWTAYRRAASLRHTAGLTL
ncbi:hypothetical protein CH63R_07075 [Colletotrichum higginsianum IMI 349063]|uniref:Uncharacterized protein n=3 Tax=Colletotrichum higginsianum TaxID=80884 RepID=A0A1B7Y8K2_COLHI|nr:hypothetical protein CH63R_07075 [Colletotrichum higginsianum IMI 349063]OBR08310.1 hypothetical protein CH63R_07075 [Colletotrichum higginsianum IMI 349063]TIC95513.1 hypothetical protein CH35J_008964 [Colletotrichum higginsianum]